MIYTSVMSEKSSEEWRLLSLTVSQPSLLRLVNSVSELHSLRPPVSELHSLLRSHNCIPLVSEFHCLHLLVSQGNSEVHPQLLMNETD